MATADRIHPAASHTFVPVSEAADPAGALGDWGSHDRLAIAIPDHTRPLQVGPVLEELLPRLAQPPKIIVGLGLHRPMQRHEIAPLLPFQPIQHRPDDCVPTADYQGIPGLVLREVAEADWSLSIGVAELHQYAGLSGGHKGVAVGCGGRQTIQALHHRARVTASGVRLGQLVDNPFRMAVDALGKAARCRKALVYVPACQRWLFGDPQAVLQRAVTMISPWHFLPEPAAGALLYVPAAKGQSLYQASRAATYLALSPHPPVKPGGELIIQAPLPEGLGSEAGFVRLLQQYRPPWSALLDGPAPQGAGAQRAVMLALLAKKYRLRITGCVNAEPFLQVGLDAQCQPAVVPEDFLQVKNPFSLLPQWRSC